MIDRREPPISPFAPTVCQARKRVAQMASKVTPVASRLRTFPARPGTELRGSRSRDVVLVLSSHCSSAEPELGKEGRSRPSSGANTAAAIVGMRSAPMTPIAMFVRVRICIRCGVTRSGRGGLRCGYVRAGRLRVGEGRQHGRDRSDQDQSTANGSDTHVRLHSTAKA
jgi:hypothetical protein